MKKYWTNFIIQNDENSAPWLCSTTDSCRSFEEAKKLVEWQKQHYRVLAAWIDEQHDGDTPKVIFHECYLDVVGNVKY